MTLKRYATRRDLNEPELISAARRLGWFLEPLDQPVDWIGCYRGVWYPIECKQRTGRYTVAQERFIERARRVHAPVLTWRTLEDVLACCGVA